MLVRSIGRCAILVAVAAAPLLSAPLQAQEDPFLWLEDVEGERAMEWVLAHNAATRDAIKALPTYQTLYDNTLDILTSNDRIAYPFALGDGVANFWTDAEHPRGIYRTTSWEEYLGGDPTWETVLDIDALAQGEGTPWAFRGISCLLPEQIRCLVNLSPGGSDANEVREFDMATKSFVEDGFRLPVSKNSVAWVDENTVLVGHNLNPDYVTTSGYAAAMRLWERGTPVEDAPIIAEVDDRNEMALFAGTQETAEGPLVTVMHMTTIFERNYLILRDGELVRLDVPADAQMGMVGDQLVLQLVSDWEVDGRTFAEGSVVSTNFQDYLAGRGTVEAVVTPGERSTVNGFAATKDYLLVGKLTNVQGELHRYWREGGTWRSEEVDVPSMGAVGIGNTSVHNNRFFFTFSSFTQPTTLYMADEDGSVTEVKSLPDQFNTDGLIVEQHNATSADGTQVPYFVVRQDDAPMDGSNPTLQYGYGGFQISLAPSYLGATGKTWVENGGVYVLANIRGGGEFGPSWWKAALLENRQRAYDDFIAVSEDLIQRGITSPEHLGVQGGSNGGLLVSTVMTQRPDLYNAVVIDVPLVDMKRYHKLLAGASWMAEYGNPDDPSDWAFIQKYSPYQNVREDVDYPKPFIFTTTKDDRVHPGHARKLAALMESQGHDLYYFENVEGGHGSGVTPEQQAETLALKVAYLRDQLARGRPVS